MNEMKNLIICFFIIFIIVSCSSPEKERKEPTSVVANFSLYEKKNIDTRLIKIALEYLDTINLDRIDSIKTCRLFIEQRNQEVTFKLSAIVHLSSVVHDVPFGYIENKNNIILIYSGMERLFIKEELPTSLKEVLEGRVLNNMNEEMTDFNPDFIPGTYNFPTWKISIRDNQFMIDKDAEPVWRINTTIHELPDSIK